MSVRFRRYLLSVCMVVLFVGLVGRQQPVSAVIYYPETYITNGWCLNSDDSYFHLCYEHLSGYQWYTIAHNFYSCDGLRYWTAIEDSDCSPGGIGNHSDQSADATSGGHFIFQSDGNMVLYSSSGSSSPVWNSHTDGYGSSVSLSVQDDGNVVLYYGGYPIWSIFT